jgi:hypothetical protein
MSSVGTALLGTAAYFWFDYACDDQDTAETTEENAALISPQWIQGGIGLELSGHF